MAQAQPKAATPPTPTTNQTTYAPTPAHTGATDGGAMGQVDAGNAPVTPNTPNWTGNRLAPDGGVIR